MSPNLDIGRFFSYSIFSFPVLFACLNNCLPLSVKDQVSGQNCMEVEKDSVTPFEQQFLAAGVLQQFVIFKTFSHQTW